MNVMKLEKQRAYRLYEDRNEKREAMEGEREEHGGERWGYIEADDFEAKSSRLHRDRD